MRRHVFPTAPSPTVTHLMNVVAVEFVLLLVVVVVDIFHHNPINPQSNSNHNKVKS